MTKPAGGSIFYENYKRGHSIILMNVKGLNVEFLHADASVNDHVAMEKF